MFLTAKGLHGRFVLGDIRNRKSSRGEDERLFVFSLRHWRGEIVAERTHNLVQALARRSGYPVGDSD